MTNWNGKSGPILALRLDERAQSGPSPAISCIIDSIYVQLGPGTTRNYVSMVGVATSKDYGIFSLTKPWNAACRKDGENGRLQKALSSASCLESVRNSGTADGYRFL